MVKRILKYSFSLLNVDKVKLGPKWNYKNVISPYHRIYYIDEGEGIISDIENELKLEPGYLYMIPSYTFCNLNCRHSLGQYFVQFFEESSNGISLFANHRSIFKLKAREIDIKNFQRLIEINPGRGINRSDDPKVYEKQIFYQEYEELNHRQNLAVFLETQGLLLQFIARFTIPEMMKERNTLRFSTQIEESVGYILSHLNLHLSVKELAERAHYNSDYYSRLFEQFTGLRPSAFITQKRIERAQYLIVTTNIKYAQIARETGFEGLSYFSKAFKKVTGISPRKYRKMVSSPNY